MGVMTAPSRSEQRELLAVAQRAVALGFAGSRWVPAPSDVSLRLGELGATFVTLEDRDGSLLGCIGTMEARDPIALDVAHHAVAAAFDDPRLPPLTVAQYERMTVEISVLSPLEEMRVHSVADLTVSLQPGVDGVLVECGAHRATFLPAVWAKIDRTDAFLVHLWNKAGLRPGRWPDGTRVWRYRTVSFEDSAPRRLAA